MRGREHHFSLAQAAKAEAELIAQRLPVEARAESWRGPFAPIKKRTVPREVKMSAKHPSRMEQD